SPDAVAVDTSLYNEESMKVTLSSEGYITDISKAIKADASYACSIDFYKFSEGASKIFFEKIVRIVEQEGKVKDWTEVAMQQLFQSGELKFKPCDISGFDWVEIDNYDDLALSDRVFSKWDERIKHVENILFDLDGTIYVGRNAITGARETIQKLVD